MTTYSEWMRLAGCVDKIGWAKKSEAKRAATDTAARYGEPRDQWRAYHCEHCGLWHTGHTDPYRDRLEAAA